MLFINESSFFEVQKYFALFNFLKMVILSTLFRRWSTLWNSTLKITALFRRCLTLLISTLKWATLLWYCLMSRGHITLTKTLRLLWKVFWVLTNVAKRLHNFVKFIKLKTYIFSRITLNCSFCKLSKRY